LGIFVSLSSFENNGNAAALEHFHQSCSIFGV
jgi:hypothetical protein